MKKRKRTTLNVEITYPAWMTAAQARREVRTLINHQVNYMTNGPDYQDVDLMTIRAVAVKAEGRT
jgi:hypothetical protein